jgi:hypothetical protein
MSPSDVQSGFRLIPASVLGGSISSWTPPPKPGGVVKLEDVVEDRKTADREVAPSGDADRLLIELGRTWDDGPSELWTQEQRDWYAQQRGIPALLWGQHDLLELTDIQDLVTERRTRLRALVQFLSLSDEVVIEAIKEGKLTVSEAGQIRFGAFLVTSVEPTLASIDEVTDRLVELLGRAGVEPERLLISSEIDQAPPGEPVTWPRTSVMALLALQTSLERRRTTLEAVVQCRVLSFDALLDLVRSGGVEKQGDDWEVVGWSPASIQPEDPAAGDADNA